jgi:acetate kinase
MNRCISECSKGDWMIIGIGNVADDLLRSKIVDINSESRIKVLGEANLDKIKTRGKSNFTHSTGGKKITGEAVRIMGFEAGIKLVFDWYIKSGVVNSLKDIKAIGFRCVFGERNRAGILTQKILDEMKNAVFFKSIYSLSLIEAVGEFKKVTNIPVVGIFEPYFHYSIPEFRRLSGLPWDWYKKLGIKKNGFNSTAHQYLTAMAYKLERTQKMNLLTIYLGESSSICAIKDGKSIDTSMSFTPDSGLLQRKGVGDIDGAALLFAMNKLGLSMERALDEISNNAGIQGIAGIGNDNIDSILDAAKKGNGRANLAVNLYIDGIRKYIGAFSTVLGNVNCIVFGGEIGEKNVFVREKCLENMDYMGIRLDLARNRDLNGELGLISSDYSVVSKTKIYIVPTDEDMVVAYFTKKVVEKGKDLPPEEMIFRL